jgi:hypothetical protein
MALFQAFLVAKTTRFSGNIIVLRLKVSHLNDNVVQRREFPTLKADDIQKAI